MTNGDIPFTQDDLKQAVKLWLQIYRPTLLGHFDLIIEGDTGNFSLRKVERDMGRESGS